MATSNLTPLTSVLNAIGWTNATTTALNTSDDSRATGGTAGELITAELTNTPSDFDTPNHVVFAVEWAITGTVSRTKNLLLEIRSSDETVIYASYTTPSRSSGTADAVDNSGNVTFTVVPTKAQLDSARLRITVQEGGGMTDTISCTIDHVTIALDYNPVLTGPSFIPSTGQVYPRLSWNKNTLNTTKTAQVFPR